MILRKVQIFRPRALLKAGCLLGLIFSCAFSHAQQSAAFSAEETFLARCSTCHAEHGEGSEVGASLNVPDLRSPAVQKNDDAFLRQIIKSGKGNMPSFARDFSDEEIDHLLQLIRSFANRKGESETNSSGHGR